MKRCASVAFAVTLRGSRGKLRLLPPQNLFASAVMPHITRRELLASAAAIPFVMNARAADPKVLVVDTHLHCFAGKDDAKFPYHKDAPYQPADAATPEHLLRVMGESGTDFAVVVHPEPYQDDHRYLEHCLAVGKEKLKGTCLFFADRPDTA